jgi:hypothetical protein
MQNATQRDLSDPLSCMSGNIVSLPRVGVIGAGPAPDFSLGVDVDPR